eukprot:s1107_g13.t1
MHCHRDGHPLAWIASSKTPCFVHVTSTCVRAPGNGPVGSQTPWQGGSSRHLTVAITDCTGFCARECSGALWDIFPCIAGQSTGRPGQRTHQPSDKA